MRGFAARILYGVLLIVGVGVAILGILVTCDRPHTPPIRDREGQTVAGSIAVLEAVTLNGIEQHILIRGHDRTDPVLLFLHGGPGMPAMYLAHRFQRELERSFVVVQWDRRGAGKSYDSDLSPDSLSTERLLSDTRELIRHLQMRLGADKVYLVGHSFGSYLGLLFAERHPEWIHAYVGVGQVINSEKSRVVRKHWVRTQARAAGHTEALADLKARGDAALEDWVSEFGGLLHGGTNWLPLLKIGLASPEYGFWDYFKIAPGSRFSSQYMQYDTIDGPLDAHVKSVEIPVYFFLGRFDYTTPSEVVVAYADSLEAPSVDVVWFDESAHFPFLEEPEHFAAAMRRAALRSP